MPKRRPGRGRNAQIERVLSILRQLDRAGGETLYDLAKQHGTNARTIRRDLEALAEAGLPVVEEPGDGRAKRWRIGYADRLTKVASLLDASHYLALRVAMDQGGAARHTGDLFTALEDLSDKIEKAVGAGGRKRLAAIQACFYSTEKFAYQRSAPDVVWVLVRAISERLVCDITYMSASPDAKERVWHVLPLKMFVHDGAVYVHAFVPKWKSVFVLNLQRMREVKVTDTRAAVPADYDPATVAAATFGVFGGDEKRTFKLRFSPEIATYIRERVWHPSQKLRDLPGGGVELTFTCALSPDVVGWIATWRKDVVAVEPAEVRRELADVGAWMAKTYRES
jgi:proteasome accessory factor B